MTTPITRFLLSVLLLSVPVLTASTQVRTEIPFPDIGEYTTVTADLHMHTVFSDGTVWPTVRAAEAWRNGLDALSITDHIEYLPNKEDVVSWFNRPYEIAVPEAEKYGLLLIRGAEITRDEPHGHFNALFLEDCNLLDTPDQRDAVKAAHDQGAFIFWNHPEWKRNDGKAWTAIQQEYLDLGWMHGLEVFNGNSYYPNAHQWALDNNLTLLGATDVHGPIDERYAYHLGQHRAMTLLFVKEKTLEGLKEALFERRTVAFSQEMLIGREEWLRPLVEASIHIKHPRVMLRGRTAAFVEIKNLCAAPLDLEALETIRGLSFPRELRLPAGKSVLIRLQGDGRTTAGEVPLELPYSVKNALVAPNTPIQVNIRLMAEYSE